MDYGILAAVDSGKDQKIHKIRKESDMEKIKKQIANLKVA